MRVEPTPFYIRGKGGDDHRDKKCQHDLQGGGHMERLEFELETVTPLFLGGAELRGKPELRAASVRGALRFWSRALFGGFTGDDAKGLESLRNIEAKVFGSTKVGASPIIVQLEHDTFETTSFSQLVQRDNVTRSYGLPGVAYLFFSARKPEREAIKPGTRFNLTLRLRPGTVENRNVLRRVCAALWLLTHLGGLGTRSRRGGGSLQVVRVTHVFDDLPAFEIQAREPSKLRDELQAGLSRLRESLPHPARGVEPPTTYDVLHPRTYKIWVIDRSFNSWDTALDSFGRTMQKFRSRKQPDYGNIKQALQGKGLREPVKRAAFGLPIIFRFTSLNNRTDTLEGEYHSRRASPLLVRVTKLANGKCVLVLTLFYSQLLPEGEKIRLKKQGPSAKVNTPGFEVLHEFLRELGTKTGPLLEVTNW